MNIPQIPRSAPLEMRIYLQDVFKYVQKVEGLAVNQTSTIPEQDPSQIIPLFPTDVTVTTAGAGFVVLDDTDGNYYRIYTHNGVLTTSASLGTAPP